MTLSTIQTGFSAGELSPSLYGRTDLAKFHQGGFTVRNLFVNYRGGLSSRAGTAYVGMCKQGAPNVGGTVVNTGPPRDIKFQFSLTQGYALEFGDNYMRIKSNGAYVTEEPLGVLSVNTLGTFLFANPHGLAVGDWVFDQGNAGFSGLIWVVLSVPSSASFTLQDLFGNPIISSTASTGGSIARIYTVATPYRAMDLPYLKTTQSADTMTLCCVNTQTQTEYPSYELVRAGATNWTLSQDSFGAVISPPATVNVVAQNSTTISTWYSYVVTAVDAATGQESVASAAANVENNDIAVNAGSNTITWSTVAGAGSYNIYASVPSYSVEVPIGTSYSYVGTSIGNTFTDSNITSDANTQPPTHQDPFARNAISTVLVTNGGTGYGQDTVGYTVSTATGSGFFGAPVVVGGSVVAFIVENGGQGYSASDSITITGGSGATVVIGLGPATGTYPAVAAYYQQRRVYAASLNNPDTQWYSQTGAFNNFDISNPVQDGDAITATPWGQQVDGVQFMVPMPGGLVTLTGGGAWQITGGSNTAITPSDITANPQAYNGCNDIVVPVVVNYDIIYLQAKGSIFRDLSYNFFVNIYTGTDLTVLSNHLFTGYVFTQTAWSEEPYKLMWCVRDDGTMLSLTYLKEQDIYAWARHDTNGTFVGVCAVTEPPVDAVYVIVQRVILGVPVYYAERMDDRVWSTPENAWCVDAGLAYPLTYPNATLQAAAADGTANISSTLLIYGGSGYTSPTVIAVDPTNTGAGAQFSATVSGGVITNIAVLTQGANYAQGTTLQISDPTGVGAVAQPVVTNYVSMAASAAVFSAGQVGNVIRVGGGVATIVAFTSQFMVLADITSPITEIRLNDFENTPLPATAGNWSISTPVMTVSGLNHLEGETVAIVADGSVAPTQVVTNGSVTLQFPASQILVGLPFTCQAQTTYLDPQGPMTAQGKRKNIYNATIRVEASRGLSVGSNQVDASTLPDTAAVAWTNMKEVKERGATIQAGYDIPLFTGDCYINIPANWATPGQVAIEQSYPMPLNLLAVIAGYMEGDTSG